jgi:RimJ/RimL family protein N-acetyltransferase
VTGAGDVVRLAPLTSADSDVLFSWRSDRRLMLLNGAYHPVSESAHRAWFERIQQQEDAFVFGIRVGDGDKLIGSCQLHSIHPVHRSAELQMRIASAEHRGRGFGSEALRALLAFAFRDLNLHRVYLHVLATNDVAVHVYEKAGFTREGVLRHGAYVDGRYVDMVALAILEHEYAADDGDADSAV